MTTHAAPIPRANFWVLRDAGDRACELSEMLGEVNPLTGQQISFVDVGHCNCLDVTKMSQLTAVDVESYVLPIDFAEDVFKNSVEE